ncbi:hypothetical protein [Pseudomonas asiatica]|uniref:hypothetical protein n=1 Tax=Pseudomonas asiatica TaxID=2219225 RepID=UPI0025A46893|nr:hypothetical protein [Pseudomonas asiatica]WJN52553.1 hypothetical protein QUR91_12335 [Pseudomonas asiatica]
MSLQHRRRVKIVNGLSLHLSCNTLFPALEVAASGLTALQRRGMESDEITIKNLQDLISQVYQERITLTEELNQREQALKARDKRAAWLRPIFSTFFLRGRKDRLDRLIAHEQELVAGVQDRIKGLGLELHWTLTQDIADQYITVLKTFSDVRLSDMIWSICSSSAVNQLTERSNVSRSVVRCPVRFEDSAPQWLTGNPTLPLLRTASGAALYLLPGIVLLENFAEFKVFSMKELVIESGKTRFLETESVPRDATLAGYSWLRENKDGSPDRRFIDNYQIPTTRYAEIRIKGWGINEEFQFSNAGYGQSFGSSLIALKHAVSWASQNQALNGSSEPPR